MHKSFLITEEDKNRILGMHQSATKRQYLNEASETDHPYSDFVTDEEALPGINKILSATYGPGTDNELLLSGFKEIKDYKKTEDQLKKAWSKAARAFRYDSIEDMLKGEMERDGESAQLLDNINNIVKTFGIRFDFSKYTNGDLNKNTIKQVSATAPNATTPNDTAPNATAPNATATQTTTSYTQYANKETIEKIQQALIDKKYNLGSYGPKKDGVDGKLGNLTANAILDLITKSSSIASTTKPSQDYKFKPQSPSTETPDDVSQGIQQPKQA